MTSIWKISVENTLDIEAHISDFRSSSWQPYYFRRVIVGQDKSPFNPPHTLTIPRRMSRGTSTILLPTFERWTRRYSWLKILITHCELTVYVMTRRGTHIEMQCNHPPEGEREEIFLNIILNYLF